MEQLFLTILNRAVTAGWLVLLVMVLRVVLKKRPRRRTMACGPLWRCGCCGRGTCCPGPASAWCPPRSLSPETC
ncbi:MAG: hypothetical protein ACLR5H_00170 [Oscillospiraceae bacterium]